MPLLLLRYWKWILGGGAILGALLYVGILKMELWHLRSELAGDTVVIAKFRAVQANNEDAIRAQNLAVRKMWKDGLLIRSQEKKAFFSSSRIMANAVSESKKPVRFKQGASCDQDVEAVFQKVRILK